MEVNGNTLPEWGPDATGPRQREANFTSTDSKPEGNEILSGEWWPVGSEESLISLEDGFADDIGAKVGDELTLRIAADEFVVTVASIRSVNWESMRPTSSSSFPKSYSIVFRQRCLRAFIWSRMRNIVFQSCWSLCRRSL